MQRLLIVAALVCVSLAVEDSKLNAENVIRFEAVDEDGNGKVTFNEFEHWHKKHQANTSDQQLKTLFQQKDVNHDSSLSISEFVQVALEMSRNPVGQTQQIFQKIDLNGDGVVTLEESRQSGDPILIRIMEGVFEVADADHNGHLTLAEFTKAIENDGKPQTKEDKDRENASRLLTLIDKNADNQLDVKEVHAFANINEKVTEEEVKLAFAYLDLDHNGFISLNELANLPNKMAELVRFVEAPPVTDN